MNSPLRLKHANGTATTTPAKISTIRGRGFRVFVFNKEASGGDNLEISFDSGNNFYPILPQTEFAEDVAFHFFYLRASSGTIDYAVMMAEG